jgi:hypothetical protein
MSYLYFYLSENESSVPPSATTGAYSSNVTEKKRIIERKLQESNMKGQKPTINAIAQGFQPSRESLSTKVKDFILLIKHSFTNLE